ncbi:hypothetical protein HZC53_03350 [Candidatus Uhrbacteria bacterium]|nr:hypothetical protein [Candidatus Uhrbacteria bacterium]
MSKKVSFLFAAILGALITDALVVLSFLGHLPIPTSLIVLPVTPFILLIGYVFKPNLTDDIGVFMLLLSALIIWSILGSLAGLSVANQLNRQRHPHD